VVSKSTTAKEMSRIDVFGASVWGFFMYFRVLRG
jgi:hypothetical protein